MDSVSYRRVVVTDAGPLRGHVILLHKDEAARLVARGVARYTMAARIEHAVQCARQDMMRRN